MRPVTRTPGRLATASRSGPSPTNASCPRLSRPNESHDVLALDERARAHDERAVARPADALPRGLGVARGERRQIDAAVDDLGLRPRRGHDGTEPVPEMPGHRDDGVRPGDRRPGHRAERSAALGVLDVRAVCGDDEPGAARRRGERARRARRHEEVGVDDVGAEPPRVEHRAPQQPEVLRRAASAVVDDRVADFVALRDELPLDQRDERPQVRIRRRRIHLRDEEDPHGRGA
jgi:hypothetical protein